MMTEAGRNSVFPEIMVTQERVQNPHFNFFFQILKLWHFES